ncbi:hypothetical protein BDN67DRAFT_984987 [Paxillus ammoniavirescens]|nr:hypothetical protein BDN67DRAFT_984987 [Paxillus ammoniavirescens]
MVNADDDHLSGSLSHPHHFDEYMENQDQLTALNNLIFPDSELGALGLHSFNTWTIRITLGPGSPVMSLYQLPSGTHAFHWFDDEFIQMLRQNNSEAWIPLYKTICLSACKTTLNLPSTQVIATYFNQWFLDAVHHLGIENPLQRTTLFKYVDYFYPISDDFETAVTTSLLDWMEVVKSKVENALVLFVMLRFQATKNLLYDIEEFHNDSVVIPATVGLLPSKAVVILKSSEWKTYMTWQLGWHDNMQHGVWIMHHVMYVKGPDTGLQEEHVKFLQDEQFDAVIKHLLFNTGLFGSIGRCTQCGSAFPESVLQQDLTDITTTAKIVFLGGYDGEAPPDAFYETYKVFNELLAMECPSSPPQPSASSMADRPPVSIPLPKWYNETKILFVRMGSAVNGTASSDEVLLMQLLQRVAPVPQWELSPREAAEHFRKTYQIKALSVLLAQYAQVTLDHLTSHHFIKWWEADDIARVVDTFSKDFNKITLESSQRLSKGCMVDQAV